MNSFIKMLLVVPDQGEYRMIRDLLGQVLHTDYQLEWRDSLDQALKDILTEPVDVILLDYHWPAGNSTHLLTAARSQGCRVPIIVMTDQMEAEVDRTAIRHGASDYLIKGRIDSQLLERTLRYAIERKAAEQRLADLAHYDPLTGVANRILFRERLEHAVRVAQRDQSAFTLMYLDLDAFKQVNDSFGHDAGDVLLMTCAERLNRCIRVTDSVARIGGDEFTLLLEQVHAPKDVAQLAQKVIDTLAEPITLAGHLIRIGCSIGIASYPEAGNNLDALQKHADLAMYQAKQVKGSHYHFFSEALNHEVHRFLKLESELRLALQEEQFVLHYQPRVDLSTGAVLGVEALLRWQHPQRGLVTPDTFMSVAESSGLIVPIGYWVMRQACRALLHLQEQGLPEIIMAINLSVCQFNDDALVVNVGEILQQERVEPGRIEFELTETTLMENLDRIALCLRALSHLGCSFSLDDFGTGYSSFVHLQRLPIAAMKIDRTFIADISNRLEDSRLVAAMVTLAHSLGKDVIAEGVETVEQQQLLLEFGCDQVQGYFYCAPLPLDTLLQKIADGVSAVTEPL